MHKILQNHLLCAFVANLKIDALYGLYPESFCGKNLAIRKVFAFCDSAHIGELFTGFRYVHYSSQYHGMIALTYLGYHSEYVKG